MMNKYFDETYIKRVEDPMYRKKEKCKEKIVITINSLVEIERLDIEKKDNKKFELLQNLLCQKDKDTDQNLINYILAISITENKNQIKMVNYSENEKWANKIIETLPQYNKKDFMTFIIRDDCCQPENLDYFVRYYRENSVDFDLKSALYNSLKKNDPQNGFGFNQ